MQVTRGLCHLQSHSHVKSVEVNLGSSLPEMEFLVIELAGRRREGG